MEVLLWAIGILVSIQTVIMGFLFLQLWNHVLECRQITARLEGVSRDLERMKADIGTHDTGMRGEIHHLSNVATQHEMRVTMLENKK